MSRAARICASIFAANLLLSLGSLNAQDNSAAVSTYRAGLKSIAIPAPTSDFVEAGPDYRVLFEPFAPDSNRLIAAFTLPENMTAVRAGNVTGMAHYALVEVLRRAEFSPITPDIFKQIADAMATQFGADLNATRKDQQDELNHRLKALNGADTPTVSVDQPVQLGVLFSKDNACGFAAVMPYSSKGNTVKMAAGIIVLHVQERVIFAYLYTKYEDEASVQWIGKTSEAWADAILAANKQ